MAPPWGAIYYWHAPCVEFVHSGNPGQHDRMIYFVTPRREAFAIRDFLAAWGAKLADRVLVMHYEEFANASALPPGGYVLSALDQLTPAGAERVAAIVEQLEAAGPRVRLLNHPRKTLQRLGLLSALHRMGLSPHRAVRADGELWNLRYPVFVREEHGHSGALTPLVHTSRELAEQLGLCMARGQRLSDLLILEFCDTVDDQGFYRKYAAFLIAGRVIPRGLALGKVWMLKAENTEFSVEMLDEERRFVLSNPHGDQLARIAEIAGVEYGRIDYGVKDGRVVTWEINLNPTIGRGQVNAGGRLPEALQPLRQATREAWIGGVVDAFVAADPPATGGGDIRVVPGPPMPPSDLLRAHDADQRHGFLRKLLRPIKPTMLRLVRALSPLFVRVRN